MMTLREYFETPETLLPQELIYGAIRVADAPFVSHQRIALGLAVALRAHVRAHDGGEVMMAPVDVVLDADRRLVLQPDLLVVSPDRSDIVRERVYGAPDLVIEVLSPRPRIGKLEERVGWFAEYGVREIWLYHQFGGRLEVLTCTRHVVAARTVVTDNMAVRSAVLPHFSDAMATVLEDAFKGRG